MIRYVLDRSQLACVADDCSSTEQLVDVSREEDERGVELDDVGAASCQLNAILRDHTWVNNVA